MSFGCQKAKKFLETSPPELPPGPCHGPARGLTASPDLQLLFALCVFHAHTIWAPSTLPMSTFFFVLTPDAGKSFFYGYVGDSFK